MKKKLLRTVNVVNKFLKNYLAKQKKTDLIIPIKYGLFPCLLYTSPSPRDRG